MRAIAVLVTVCLLAAGCTSSGNGPSPTPSNGRTRSDSATRTPSAATALRITSPHSGDVLALPAAVRYELDAAPAQPVIRMYSGTSPIGDHRDFTLTGPQGSITLPDDKALAGQRTLTFCLASGAGLIEGTCQTLVLTLTGRK